LSQGDGRLPTVRAAVLVEGSVGGVTVNRALMVVGADTVRL